jgi:hypothetical protein
MADSKISQLTSATTPLSGTEVVPIVQNGVTKKVAVSAIGGSSTLTLNNKTSDYTIVSSDSGKVINFTSGSFTAFLTSASTLGSGFNCWIWNTSAAAADAITITPDASQTIDGRTLLFLRRGEGMQIVSDGTNWQTGDKKTMRGYAENYTANATRPTASGSNSIALGNSYASGADSFAAAITNNTGSYGATGANSIAYGYLAKATAPYSVAIGLSTIASGQSSFVLGDSASSTISGKYAYASGLIATTGDAQKGLFVLRASTTNATPTTLVTNAATPKASNQIVLPLNSAHAFAGLIVARQSAANGTQSAAWKVEGLVRVEGSAATATLVASTVTAISNVPGWAVALSANVTHGGLLISVTGGAATNIRWLATIDTAEIIYT